MTKLERDLLAIIKENAYGWTQAEIVGLYVERHLGPALVSLQKQNKATSLLSNAGWRLAPVIKGEMKD